MKSRFNFLLVSFLFFTSCAFAQSPIKDLAYYESRVQAGNDTLYVVNFWATWCKPCVAELPYFEKAAKEFSGQPVKIILISQDTKTRAVQVSDFIKKNNYTSENFILSAGNPNVWIDKVEPKWEGVIPVTIYYRNGKKVYFHDTDYEDYASLQKHIQSSLK